MVKQHRVWRVPIIAVSAFFPPFLLVNEKTLRNVKISAPETLTFKCVPDPTACANFQKTKVPLKTVIENCVIKLQRLHHQATNHELKSKAVMLKLNVLFASKSRQFYL